MTEAIKLTVEYLAGIFGAVNKCVHASRAADQGARMKAQAIMAHMYEHPRAIKRDTAGELENIPDCFARWASGYEYTRSSRDRRIYKRDPLRVAFAAGFPQTVADRMLSLGIVDNGVMPDDSELSQLIADCLANREDGASDKSIVAYLDTLYVAKVDPMDAKHWVEQLAKLRKAKQRALDASKEATAAIANVNAWLAICELNTVLFNGDNGLAIGKTTKQVDAFVGRFREIKSELPLTVQSPDKDGTIKARKVTAETLLTEVTK